MASELFRLEPLLRRRPRFNWRGPIKAETSFYTCSLRKSSIIDHITRRFTANCLPIRMKISFVPLITGNMTSTYAHLKSKTLTYTLCFLFISSSTFGFDLSNAKGQYRGENYRYVASALSNDINYLVVWQNPGRWRQPFLPFKNLSPPIPPC